MDTVIRFRTLDKAVCVLHSADNIEKGKNPIMLVLRLRIMADGLVMSTTGRD